MKIEYLPSALHDFERFRDFLFANGVSAGKIEDIFTSITKALSSLENNPLLGFSIGGKYGLVTLYRGFICEDYIAIYEVSDRAIQIVRMYSIKENYICDLMGEA